MIEVRNCPKCDSGNYHGGGSKSSGFMLLTCCSCDHDWRVPWVDMEQDDAVESYTNCSWYDSSEAPVLTPNVSEFMKIEKVLTEHERQLMEGYLAWKWKLQQKLPEDHPWKYAAPIAAKGDPHPFDQIGAKNDD